MVCEATIQVQPPEQQQLEDTTTAVGQNVVSCDQPILHFNWDQRARAKACMQTLVMALADDPVNSYFSGSKRVKFCKDEVKGYLKALPDATNFISTADSMAVALWQLLPKETPRNELWAGWTRILRVPPRLWRQLLKLELRYEAAHDDASEQFGSYYYLSFIGSRPEARGRGYGSLLLSHITQRADAEGRWCMLEATSDKSQALYARHGFVTYETYRVSKKSPPVFLMKRSPAAPAPAAAAAAAVVVSSTPLSAAALQLAAAVHGKAGLAAAVASPGSECGHSTCSSLISAVVRGHEVESDTDGESVSDIEEESEGEEEEEEEKCDLKVVPADAGVIIRSNSSVLRLKEKGHAEVTAAEVTAAAADLGICSSGSSNNTGSMADGSTPPSNQSSSSSSSRSSSSSSSAGAGGPSDDAAAGSA